MTDIDFAAYPAQYWLYAAAHSVEPWEVDATDGGFEEVNRVLFEFVTEGNEVLAKALGMANPEEAEDWQILEAIAELRATQTSPPRGPSTVNGLAGSQPRGGEPVGHWEIVRAAIERGLSEYAAAYFIPAWGIFGTDYPRQRSLADTWGELAAPHITACIREDLRRTGAEPDWKRIAVKLASMPGADFVRLSTPEADALRGALADVNACQEEADYERTEDAKTGLEDR